MSDICESYGRKIKDLTYGGWSHTTYNVKRRYCKECRNKPTPRIRGVLPGESYGTRIIAAFTFLRCLGLSFENMQEIIYTLHGLYVPRSTIVKLCFRAATELKQVRNKILADIINGKFMSGDETGWFLNGMRHWVRAVVTKTSAFYHNISSSRAGLVSEAIASEFDGILNCDSYSDWNTIGRLRQRCLLHYFRDLYRTVNKNPSSEYSIFLDNLRCILHDAIDLASGIEDEIKCIRYRIDELINTEWSDHDCKRYIKRLKREKDELFTFLEYPIDHHNNASEQILRCISRMRKVLYGSHSESGMQTTKTLVIIHSM